MKKACFKTSLFFITKLIDLRICKGAEKKQPYVCYNKFSKKSLFINDLNNFVACDLILRQKGLYLFARPGKS